MRGLIAMQTSVKTQLRCEFLKIHSIISYFKFYLSKDYY